MAMDPCTQLCHDLGVTIGPETLRWLATIVGIGVLWWRNRKTATVAATATEQASKAKSELRDARLSLARIEGSLSLRPAAIPAELLPAILPAPSSPALHGEQTAAEVAEQRDTKP